MITLSGYAVRERGHLSTQSWTGRIISVCPLVARIRDESGILEDHALTGLTASNSHSIKPYLFGQGSACS